MFKLTVYKKVNISRNVFLLILICLLVLVGGKIILAHEKLATFKEAIEYYQAGELVAAEEKFRAAKRNVSVTDHNKDINRILGVLSPIREAIAALDEQATNNHEESDLDNLVETYDRWQESQKKWVSGTAVQKDMYEEMVALTLLDKDFLGYFATIKKTNLAKLANATANVQAKEEAIFNVLQKIPAQYYDGDPAKTKEIQTAFQAYYAAKINKSISANASVAGLVAEGNRQFGMLVQFSIDSGWLVETLDTHLVKVLNGALTKKDYASFAEQANTTKGLSSNMSDALVFPLIEKAKNEILAKAKNLAGSTKYEEALAIYAALKPLENTDLLITNTNLAWDKYEPIRVLKRLYAGKEFPVFVNSKNKWGADSIVAAISKDGGIYFGMLKGEEAMALTEGKLTGSPTINTLTFQSNLTKTDNPVIMIDAFSAERKHHYLAYEVRTGRLVKILDVEADNLTVEAGNVLLVDNPVGSGAGEFTYYEPNDNEEYQFKEIKVDYVDIQVRDIAEYYGKKVRFTAYTNSTSGNGSLVTLTETYNFSTSRYEKTYLLLQGQSGFTIYSNFTVIGVFNSYTNITNDYGESVSVPVFQVEKSD
jgi:hypothetical protein